MNDDSYFLFLFVVVAVVDGLFFLKQICVVRTTHCLSAVFGHVSCSWRHNTYQRHRLPSGFSSVSIEAVPKLRISFVQLFSTVLNRIHRTAFTVHKLISFVSILRSRCLSVVLFFFRVWKGRALFAGDSLTSGHYRLIDNAKRTAEMSIQRTRTRSQHSTMNKRYNTVHISSGTVAACTAAAAAAAVHSSNV